MAPDQPKKKQQIVSNELESGTNTPPELYDDLPDPDAGRSGEERARLVQPVHIFFCAFLTDS